jgi:siroheme synthase-like protein
MNPERLPGMPVELRLDGRRVLVLHGPEHVEAVASRLEALAECGAAVTTSTELETDAVEGFHLVLFWPTDQPELARACAARARAAGRLVWCQDAPDLSDLTLPALLECGPVRIAVSTGGRSSALARAVRNALQPLFDPTFADQAWLAVRGRVRRPSVRVQPDAARVVLEPQAPDLS